MRVLLDGGSVVPGGNINVLGNKTHLSTAAAVPTPPPAAAQQQESWRQRGDKTRPPPLSGLQPVTSRYSPILRETVIFYLSLEFLYSM